MGAISLSSNTAAAAILHLVLLLAAAGRHGATEYAVGDSAGWTIGPNYLTWSQKYNFTAGDTLGTYIFLPKHSRFFLLLACYCLIDLVLIDYTNNLSQCSTT